MTEIVKADHAAIRAGRMPRARMRSLVASSCNAARNACTPGRSRQLSDHQEVVFLRRHRQERQVIHARHRLDRKAPVGAPLRDRGRDRVVRFRLVGIAGGPRAVRAFWSIRTRVPEPALRLTIRHSGSASAAAIAASAVLPSKRASPCAVEKALRALPAFHQRQAVLDQMRVVAAGLRIDQMHRRDIAFAAPRRGNAAQAADRDARARKIRARPARRRTTSSAMSWLPMITTSGARAAAPISVTLVMRVGIERGRQRIDLDESRRPARRRSPSPSLSARGRRSSNPRPAPARPARIPCGRARTAPASAPALPR